MSAAKTILFVEDEAFVRDVTCEVLRSAGYRVLTAKNAAEAVRLHEACGDGVEPIPVMITPSARSLNFQPSRS